jgi:hypothetical protein
MAEQDTLREQASALVNSFLAGDREFAGARCAAAEMLADFALEQQIYPEGSALTLQEGWALFLREFLLT